MTGVNEIRDHFLTYFEKNGHAIVDSSPLVPRNDPTLMFTNAGMVQFKNVFTGQEQRDPPRAVTSQKCVRAGGKHNDLDNVGYTARHHTFFEMLGNFSFGDYFKDRAIELAWNLVTKEFGLDAKRLLVTVYEDDDQAFDLWKKIAGIPEDRIIRIGDKPEGGSDNFWAMGDTGPCGPCSEIFFDHGDHIWGGPPGTPEEDGDRFVEIWNLVFMQFEQRGPGDRIELPKPSIDTGMGLERIAAVLQGTHDNYETDLFKALIGTIKNHAVDAGAVLTPASDDEVQQRLEAVYDVGLEAPFRVIADHLRASSFLIADGVLPSNEGRGYVLRRVMRRAMRYAHQLGCKDPLMHTLVSSLVNEMGQAFPELQQAQPLIVETLKLEETRFKQTLGKGLRLLEDATVGFDEGDELDGEVAFKLYDTYGFPLDLTQDALRRRGVSVDIDAFNAAMERQKAEARAAWKGSGDTATEEIWFEIRDAEGATEFLGYETEQAEGEVRALVKDGKSVKTLKKGDEAALIINQTPFYGESGGQVGDAGVIRTESFTLRVTDTQKKLGDLFVHFGTVEQGKITTGDVVELQVDHTARTATRANHSATHLVHEALREVLGTHVTQKGSLVSPDRLRFDFAHPKPMDRDELATVERMANAIILQNAPVTTRLMSIEDARETGAMALFGEKYGEEVRVVAMGTALEGEKSGAAYSVELCGGTHVGRTGDIGLVKLVGESAVASGVRRLEALTGEGARAYLNAQDETLRETAARLKVKPEDVAARVDALMTERKTLERQLAEAKKQLALGGGASNGADASDDVREIAGTKLLARALEGISPKDLRGLVDESKKRLGSGVVAIVGVSDEGKAGLAVGVTDDLTDRLSAVDLVRVGAEAIGGKGGGGRADMAQAGGPDGQNAAASLDAIAAAMAG